MLIYWPSGVWKTSVWKVLADLLKRTHVDIDALFEERKNRKISDFVQENWWDSFRQEESSLFSELIQESDSKIITLGWWTLLNPCNAVLARSAWKIIILMASREVIIERIGWDSNNIRPLVKSKDDISKIYDERYPHYMSFWNTYHTGGDSIDEIARKIHVSQYI